MNEHAVCSPAHLPIRNPPTGKMPTQSPCGVPIALQRWVTGAPKSPLEKKSQLSVAACGAGCNLAGAILQKRGLTSIVVVEDPKPALSFLPFYFL